MPLNRIFSPFMLGFYVNYVRIHWKPYQILLQFLLLIVTYILRNLRGDIYHLCSSLIPSVPSFPLLLFPFSLKNFLEHFSYRKYVVLLNFPSSQNWLYFAFIPEFILSRYSYFLSALQQCPTVFSLPQFLMRNP